MNLKLDNSKAHAKMVCMNANKVGYKPDKNKYFLFKDISHRLINCSILLKNRVPFSVRNYIYK